ncbi:torsin-2A-like isoform X2 [Scylla paramamosain]|uniref:torsin-2A-like isoform X2 n=1 Tax=Scylla paramamosain TaxID=85552 RepID=UPI003083CEF0
MTRKGRPVIPSVCPKSAWQRTLNRARLSLDSEEEPLRPRSATPSQPPGGHLQTQSRRSLLVRSASAGPWTAHTVTYGSRRPGRSLTRDTSKKRELPPPSAGRSRWCWCVVALISILIAVASSSLYLVTDLSFLIANKELSCRERRNAEFPITELKNQLKKNIVGQNLAIESLVHNLKMFAASSAERPFVLWLSGWEGSGKTLTINIIKGVLPKEFRVQTVLAQLLPGSAYNLQEKAMGLVQGLEPCAPNLLVIDGWDGESRLPLAILEQFLKSLHLPEATTQNASRVLVVLSGTRGGRDVWQHFLDLQRKEGGETNFLEHDFTNLSLRLQNTHYLASVTSNVALVPFLPMDLAQIKSCVVRELLRMQREDVVIDEAALARVMKEVSAHTEFVPGSDPPLAIHGCKRVPALLALVLSGSLDDLRL